MGGSPQGMDGIIDTMRQAVYDAQAETSKIAAAYQPLHADSLARNEATAGLKSMIGLAGSGPGKRDQCF